jgi:NADH:ubiquinone oxidoreductase subunit 5 (subunit L)/multisubunit Na+/H+ antiporter MnhA subunit
MAATMACSLVASLAIAGVPPLNGFTSKWLLYATGILGARASFMLPVAALIAMFVSLMTLASFLKYLGGAFLGATAEPPQVREVPMTMLAPQVLLAAACLVVGLAPMPALHVVHRAIVELPSAALLPSSDVLFGAGPSLTLASSAVAVASWAPFPLAVLLAALVAGVYYGLQTAGGAATRRVQVWACGEEENPAWMRYRADSLYRPFKDAVHVTMPRLRMPEIAVPGFLARIVDVDRWLYRPLARGTNEAARGVSRAHVGIPQVYLLWIIIGAIALVALLQLLPGGGP